METHQITVAQISASSQFSSDFAPTYRRLHFKGSSGAWSAAVNDLNQWFQIDLPVEANVTFVATQGRHGDSNQWVTQYKLQYSNDGLTFQFYKETRESSDKVRTVFADHSCLSFVIRPCKQIKKYRQASDELLLEPWQEKRGCGGVQKKYPETVVLYTSDNLENQTLSTIRLCYAGLSVKSIFQINFQNQFIVCCNIRQLYGKICLSNFNSIYQLR